VKEVKIEINRWLVFVKARRNKVITFDIWYTEYSINVIVNGGQRHNAFAIKRLLHHAYSL
jgi:hypothetical protein